MSPTSSPTPEESEARLLAIVEAIRRLAPSQRRRLLRRLRVSGLLESTEEVADRNRLQIAPAVAYVRTLTAEEPPSVPPAAATLVTPQAPPLEPVRSPAPPEGYRTPVSGKVVIGVPSAGKTPAAAHEMAPLPGQAPEQPIVIIFDGGSRGDPGQGYGRYALRWPGMPQQIVRLRFGDRVTAHEAEYDTLIAALEAVRQRLYDNSAKPDSACLELRGESALVINQVQGTWECDEPPLQLRCDRVRFLLKPFGRWTLAYYRREPSTDASGD